MSAHTPEPWYVAHHQFIYAADHLLVGQTACPPALSDSPVATQAINAERIVACVNACAGIPTSVLEANSAYSKILTASDIVALRMHHTEMMELRQQRDALQQRCEELVDIAHECQKIIKELCACYSHHEPIATLERIEAIKQVQP